MRSLSVRVLLALALTSAPAIAADPLLVLGPSPDGLSAPGGMVIDNAGRTWVTDAARGVCRLDVNAVSPLLASDYCPAVGAAPAVRPGPTKPAGLAYDPASNTLFVGDGGSLTGSVWRLPINGAGVIAGGQRMLTIAGDRVFGLAFSVAPPIPANQPGGPDAGGPVVDYVTKIGGGAVLRVKDPATCPADACNSTSVGSSEAPEGIAELGGHIYLADEALGATWIETPGNGSTTAQPLFPGDITFPGAIAVDPVHQRVYLAMAEPTGGDRIDVLDLVSGIRDIYVDGPVVDGRFGAVTAMVVEPNGDLLIADDPSVAAGGEGVGTARLYRAPFGSIAAPRVSYTSGPAAVTSASSVGVAFRSRSGATFACHLDGGAPVACGTGPLGTFAVGPLPDGAHVIDITAQDSFGTGPVARRRFTIDTRAPIAKIDNAATDETALDGFFTLRFSADEPASFQCAANGTSFALCDDGWRLAGLATGVHSLAVRAVDLAGNVGPSVVWRVNSVPSASARLTSVTVAGAGQGMTGSFTQSQRNLLIVRAACRRVGGRLVSKRVVIFRGGKRVRVARLVCVKPKKKVVKKKVVRKTTKEIPVQVRRTP